MRCAEPGPDAIRELLERYGVRPHAVASGEPIPGSYWGDSEAGLRAGRLFFRADTPVHSLLHELAHYVCMDPLRRLTLDTHAGSDDAEECAVCYLEVVLANGLPPCSAARCLADMDTWGYSFRQGSAHAWFQGDGREARDWLLTHGLIDTADRPLWRLRG